MGYRGKEIPSAGFAGGMHSNTPVTELEADEAYDLSNIVLSHSGKGFRTRYANATFNSTAMNSGANVQGLGYFKPSSGNDHLVAICGAKAFESTSLDGTMNDITGAVSISAGQNNIWTQVVFNDKSIWFGGPATSPDAPIRYTGAGNMAALAGSPPSAYGAFQANNRVFAFRTSSAPDTIYWSIVGNEADWTGVGSGSSSVWTKDGDSLTAAAVMSNSTVLLFKQNSVHKMMINTLVSSAFPIFPLFEGVGCVGKHACVVAYGLCYFITPEGSLRVTDGNRILQDSELPNMDNIDDIWAGIPSSRYQYIQGKHIVGIDYDHIVWIVSYGSGQTTNNYALVWDIKNNCWLRHKTGYKANVIELTQTGSIYTGHYNGKIYLQDATTTGTTDASEGNLNIDSYWQSGWQKQSVIENIKQPRKAILSFGSQTQGTIQFSWGFDYSYNSNSASISQTSPGGRWGELWGVMLWGGATDYSRSVRIVGRGNLFSYRIRNVDFKMKINTIEFSGKEYGQKEITVR